MSSNDESTRRSLEEMVRLKGERASVIDLHFHAEVGRLIRTFAYVEEALSAVAAQLLGCDENRVEVLWSTIPTFRLKLTLTERLAETYLDESVIGQFRELARTIEALSAKRNLLAHSTGRVSMDAAPHLIDKRTFRADIGLGFSWVEVTDGEVVAWTESLSNLQGQLFEFARAIRGAVHKEPRIRRQPAITP